MAKFSSTATIVAENTFCTPVCLFGKFNFSVAGISGDTVVVQRSFDSGATWKDAKSYTIDTEDTGEESEDGILYRAGCKTGGYSAGTILIRLSR